MTHNDRVTDYLLDVQPALAQVVAATTGADTERYLHDPRGLLAQADGAGDWHYAVNDALGSLRGQLDVNYAVEGMRHFRPYGQPFAEQGGLDGPFAFTGEPRDANGLQYHRARYYAPALGVWPSLDPLEGVIERAMSLNGYMYASGNPINRSDPSGEQDCNPNCVCCPPSWKWLCGDGDIICPCTTPNFAASCIVYGNGTTSECAYSRYQAVKYALDYYDGDANAFSADAPCGSMDLGIGTDCANFASQVLHAGGLLHTDTWFRIPRNGRNDQGQMGRNASGYVWGYS